MDYGSIFEEDSAPESLRANPTLQKVRSHEEEITKGPKALSFIHTVVSDSIFTRIMTCESAKKVWDMLKQEFQGSDGTRQMQILNLRKEFEMLRMKETEKVKDYIDRIMKIINHIRLLGKNVEEQRIVEKVMVTLPEKFEAKISSIEDTWDMFHVTLNELSNALLAVQKRKAFREEESTSEIALVVVQRSKAQLNGESKRQQNGRHGKEKNEQYNNRGRYRRSKYPPCPYCKKTNHTYKFCWYRPRVQCKLCKQFGHVDKVCKTNQNQPAKVQAQPAQVTENVEDSEEKLFGASIVGECNVAPQDHYVWLVDSGCMHHMTVNLNIFEWLDKNYFSKVRLGDGRLVDAKGKRAVDVQTPTDKTCEIMDPTGIKLLSVKMNNRSFPLDWKHTDIGAYVSIQDETYV
ncbi:hypothetical protein KY290_036873 [Solanum tuberosum]|uniref:Retrovirus-related Pol polyprotein from transposon TNT 1-94-like beta-barrel domain-containing protein n=1 Tax=Solanum tuberosum TaxID=4113 RepID=A0ABQ7TW00_SOLTU|nr:hypothetical protein KY289_036343 [Solanum tuberosum]KAH0639609.1 hypothetical protein KY285_036195 [Solanum tuberosum]KAH0738168.1 hypothetical protein KY290_036873 [Solanum tuberosum]